MTEVRDQTSEGGGMKALSLWQPWASLIAAGVKRFETRGWPTTYRGPLAIHASKTIVLDLTPDLASLCDQTFGTEWAETLPAGRVIAVCDLVDCVSTTMAWQAEKISNIQFLCGYYAPGRFAFELANVRALKSPVPLRGRQKLFNIDEIVVAE